MVSVNSSEYNKLHILIWRTVLLFGITSSIGFLDLMTSKMFIETQEGLNLILCPEALSGVGKSEVRDQYDARCFRVRPFRVKGLPSRQGSLQFTFDLRETFEFSPSYY